MPLLEVASSAPTMEIISESKIESTDRSAVSIRSAESSPPAGAKFKKNLGLSKTEQLAAVRRHLLESQAPSLALERLNAYEAKSPVLPSEKTFSPPRVEIPINRAPFRIETFIEAIKTAPVSKYQIDFVAGRNFLNTPRAPADPRDDPRNYLAEGGEIEFTPAIRNKAAELNRQPLALLNFVRNEIEYIPYFGSKKGANATLLERAGNDMDQASLLVALLRASDIPARYRRAEIKVSLRAVTDLLGVESPIAAAKILSLEKIPYTLYVLENDEPSFFVIEHTYVEAHLPYG
ncbi:MAG: transglutaminase-like domain-containing protein, partial [archaeon]